MPSASSPASGQSTYTVPCLINGQEYHTKDTFNVVSPTTGSVVHRCCSVTAEDAATAANAAAEAFQKWRKVLPAQRRDIFLKAAEIMSSRRQELAQYLVDETGGSHGWAEFNLDVATSIIKDVAGRIATLEGSFPTVMSPDTSAIVMQEPYGVVLAAAPWYVHDVPSEGHSIDML